MRQLQTEILVIGGGSTGTGVAWDAALRGFQVVLVEKRDLTHGTTGRYHGLLHSGGRYVVKDPRSAEECIQENRILRQILTHCIEETGGFFVVTPEDEGDYPDRFVRACAQVGIPCAELSIAAARKEEPLLNPRASRVFQVPDAVADSFLATHTTAQAACQAGANILTYHEVIELLLQGGEGDRRVTGARVRDMTSGEEMVIHADMVINASGAWAGQIVKSAGVEVKIIPGKGVMVAMNHRIVNTVLNRCKMPADGDIIVPIHTVAVIGTTDEKVADPERLMIEPWEVALMLEEGEKLVPGISHARVLRAWAGVRPLYQEGFSGESRDATRALTLLDHRRRDGVSGFLTITGGKWTTFRLMAETTVDKACEQLGTRRPCTTATTPVPGIEQGHYWLGHRLHEVEEDRLQNELICECELVTRGMVERAIQQNPTVTLDDLRRDVRLGMGPCQGGFCTLRAAGIFHALSRKPANAAPQTDHNASIAATSISTISTPNTRPGVATEASSTTTWDVAHLQSPAHNPRMEVGESIPALPLFDANLLLRDFLQERWKGLTTILWGQQLKQERLDQLIYLSLLNVDHLPDEGATSPLTDFYRHNPQPPTRAKDDHA
jgi:glycerol-3-phosphate dehydrogenase